MIYGSVLYNLGCEKSDTSSKSSDESTCTLETVNPMGTLDKRPLKKY